MADPGSRNDFCIAFICALAIEAECVLALLDVQWDNSRLSPMEGDTNAYTLGMVGAHNVVVVHMPGMGTISAAGVTAHLRMSFPSVQLALVVGMCGGVPGGVNGEDEVILGDVMISSALVQYDLGREYSRGFQIKTRVEDSLGRGSPAVRSLMNKLKTAQHLQKLKVSTTTHLRNINVRIPSTVDPGIASDHLFDSSYLHQHHSLPGQAGCHACQETDLICERAIEASCTELGCDNGRLVRRRRLQVASQSSATQHSRTSIFFTSIASGNKVMKSARERDRLAKELKVGAFEMEGAGVWEFIPTIVIKGVADYADCHKNKSYQRFAASTAAACAKAVLAELPSSRSRTSSVQIPTRTLSASPQTNGNRQNIKKTIRRSKWMVPFTVSKPLVGREEEIQQLNSKLAEKDGPRYLAITGLTGIGKSRLALELASTIREEKNSTHVFWVQATSRQSFKRDMSQLGDALGIRVPRNVFFGPEVDTVASISSHLSRASTGAWMLVLDGADDEALWGKEGSLKKYLPRSKTGFTLVTTRNRRIGFELASSNSLEIGAMGKNEAPLLMKHHITQRDWNVADTSVDEIMLCLGRNPLNIVQAASYAMVNGTSPRDYLKLLQGSEEQIIEALEHEFVINGRYSECGNSIISAWKVSIQRLHRQNKLATDYLTLMCCMAEDPVPKALLSKTSPIKAQDEALALLKSNYMIFEQNSQFAVDQFVRLATRAWLRKNSMMSSALLNAMQRLAEIFPEDPNWDDESTWVPCLTHAHHVCQSELVGQIDDRNSLRRRVAVCFARNGRLNKSLEELQHLASWEEKEYGRSDYRFWSTQLEIGIVYRYLEDNMKSEAYCETAYDYFSTNFGDAYPKTLRAKYFLAVNYYYTDRKDEAESILEYFIAACDQHDFEQKIAWMISAKRLLACLYAEAGRFGEAEALIETALNMRPAAVRMDYPSTLEALDSLARMALMQNRHSKAEGIFLQILEHVQDSPGQDNLRMFKVKIGLGYVYLQQGKYGKAEKQFVDLIEAMGLYKTFGKDSLNSLTVMEYLAMAQKGLGETDKALHLINQCAEISVEKHGEDHECTQRRIHLRSQWTQEIEKAREPWWASRLITTDRRI